MKVSDAVEYYLDYHRINSKKNTVISYEPILTKFSFQYGVRNIESINSDEILSFLTCITKNIKQTTKRLRYIILHSFLTSPLIPIMKIS